jgi:hypothetical protein
MGWYSKYSLTCSLLGVCVFYFVSRQFYLLCWLMPVTFLSNQYCSCTIVDADKTRFLYLYSFQQCNLSTFGLKAF